MSSESAMAKSKSRRELRTLIVATLWKRKRRSLPGAPFHIVLMSAF
jgi:hypothetical protein